MHMQLPNAFLPKLKARIIRRNSSAPSHSTDAAVIKPTDGAACSRSGPTLKKVLNCRPPMVIHAAIPPLPMSFNERDDKEDEEKPPAHGR